MRMRSLVVAVLLVAGCKKEKAATPLAPSPKGPTSTVEQDALWKLAPDGAFAGVVMSSKAITSLESGWLSVKKLMATAPELAPALAELEAELTKTFGSSNVTLADVGLAPGKGFAAFFVRDAGGTARGVALLPVVDRDKFLKVTKGTKGADGVDMIDNSRCKTSHGFYVCADLPDLFDRLGKGSMQDKLALVGARGDIELAGTIPDSATPLQAGAVLQIERGAYVARAAIKGLPALVTDKLKAAGKQTIDPTKVAGFAVMNVAPMLAGVPVPPEPIAPGVTVADLVNNGNGPVRVMIMPGSMVFDLHIPMKDTGPAQKLVGSCDQIPPLQMLGAKVTNGVCHVNVPQMQMELDAWIEGNELRVGKKGAPAPSVALAPTAVGNELAQGDWAFAMYGRGTLAGEGQFPPIPLGAMPDESKMALRAMLLLNEIGLGVRADGDVVHVLFNFRTAWSNPDDVVAKLIAIPPESIVQGKAAAAGKQIASASPSSPFAADYKAGLGGLMIPTATIGILAAVAIPAYMDYMKKSKRTEAALQLNKLAKNAKVAFITNSEFPKGKVGLTPSKSCCEYHGKCDEPSAWKNPVWQSLDFEIGEPHLYRYSYQSDGKTFTAKAVADLDCDGIEVEYVLTGSADAQGNVTTNMTEPAPGTD